MVEQPKSKTQRKREHLALIALAETLVSLPESQVERMPLDEDAHEAVLAARRVSRGARRRQLRYLARLLCDQDLEPLREAVAACRGRVAGRRRACIEWNAGASDC